MPPSATAAQSRIVNIIPNSTSLVSTKYGIAYGITDGIIHKAGRVGGSSSMYLSDKKNHVCAHGSLLPSSFVCVVVRTYYVYLYTRYYDVIPVLPTSWASHKT